MRAPLQLKCEYAVNPLGIDTTRPRFSWLLESGQRAQMQSAYRILVARSRQELQADAGTKSDSGRVALDRSVNVAYAGGPPPATGQSRSRRTSSPTSSPPAPPSRP